MKKKLIYLFIVLSLGFLINSCSDERLDIQPLNILTSDQVFANESAIKAYMVSLYDAMHVEDFINLRSNYWDYWMQNSTDEAITNSSFQRENIGNGTNFPWWGYDKIRNVNDLMAKLKNSKISQELNDKIMGEALFIRAFYYFSIVKRYGGVPIISEVQNLSGNNIAEVQVPRNTEKEVYDFIAADLDKAATLLPETNEKGRVTKYAALALKSRAMLYAASISKYGSVQLNGILGIPSADANKYWQAALDAAKAVTLSGKYSLYMAKSDKAINFQQLFIDKGNNPEAIFTKYYLFPDKVHYWDCMMLPYGIRGPDGYGSFVCPTLDLVEQYENIDGSPGILNIGTPSNPVFYTKPTDLFSNKDPRLLGSVIVPFSTFKGVVIDMQSGLYDQGVKVEAGDYSALYNPTTHQQDMVNGTMHIVGLNGPGVGEKSPTGFVISKYLDTNVPRELCGFNKSSQHWIVFRYAEVLLNYAEAAFELGMINEAKEKINMIRSRAGIAPLNDVDVTINRIRKERNNELAFENHRWWDLRRWRTADILLNNWWPRKLKPYFDIQKNAYRFETDKAGKYAKTFNPIVYYEKIDPNEILKNPNLIQNPGY
jgi:starch-binding outer membrane protein, SusD/RagB family